MLRAGWLLGACALLGACGSEVVSDFYDSGAIRTRAEIRRSAEGVEVLHGRSTRYWEACSRGEGMELVPRHMGLVKWTREYRDGKAHGPWIHYYLNGSVKEHFEFAKGLEDGAFRKLDPDGSVRVEGAWRRGKRHGRWRFRDAAGDVVFETELADGTGEWARVEDGRVVLRGKLVDGEWDGPRATLGRDGSVVGETVYRRGRLADGPTTRWLPNGGKLCEGELRDGLREGRWIFNHGGGVRLAEGEFRRGKMTGRWKFWHDVDVPWAEGTYVDGRAEGSWTFRDGAGGNRTRLMLRRGEMLTGIHVETYPDGAKRLERGYRDGEPGGVYRRFDEGGVLREDGFADGDERYGKWTFFDESGRPSGRGEYREGERDGVWTWFHPNGRVRREGLMKDDAEVGEWTLYHANGEKAALGPIREGERHGAWTLWDAEGRRAAAGAYRAGKRHGHWQELHPNGVPASSGSYADDRKCGVWKTFDDRGRKLSEQNLGE